MTVLYRLSADLSSAGVSERLAAQRVVVAMPAYPPSGAKPAPESAASPDAVASSPET